MPQLSYRQPGLTLRPGSGSQSQIRDLQHDLRRLGYLKAGIDGHFGDATRTAVLALQHDLLFNGGKSTGDDGPAPVRVMDYNRGRVQKPAEADQPLVECVSDMLDDPSFPKLPFSQNPVADNTTMRARLWNLTSTTVPIPFLLSILEQESRLRHYNEPQPGDEDGYIVLGLDMNAKENYVITSRGYGVGQYTLFHHPPRPEEIAGIMLDPAANVAMAISQLRAKFDRFIVGKSSSAADDRIAEVGTAPLRLCKHPSTDPRYMTDCRQCALDAGTQTITASVTPLYAGATETYQTTKYYRQTQYPGVPVRKEIGCDWPYAVRRYNGSGVNSYWYQTRILLKLAKLQPPAPGRPK